MKMNDAELAEYLHLTPDEAAIVIPQITPSKRELYNRMKQFQTEAELWARGEGPPPAGVLLDFQKE